MEKISKTYETELGEVKVTNTLRISSHNKIELNGNTWAWEKISNQKPFLMPLKKLFNYGMDESEELISLEEKRIEKLQSTTNKIEDLLKDGTIEPIIPCVYQLYVTENDDFVPLLVSSDIEKLKSLVAIKHGLYNNLPWTKSTERLSTTQKKYLSKLGKKTDTNKHELVYFTYSDEVAYKITEIEII